MFDLSNEDKEKILDEGSIRASQKSVRCVYAMASELGYSTKHTHDEFRPSHLTQEGISELIEYLKSELEDMRGDEVF